MKTFPPLHPLVSAGLPAWPSGDLDEIRPCIRARFNAEIDTALGQLLLDLWEAADDLDEGMILALSEIFGRCATAAAITGDSSFFDQVSYCVSFGSREPDQNHLERNMTARGAYLMAQLVAGKDAMHLPPHASSVARMIDAEKGNPAGTTAPSAVKDLCARQAVSLPLAEGKRGPRKN
jgi:hypothetical protein